MIVVIIIAVLGLVIVNAMKHSPWATFTVFATIPIAIVSALSCATGVPAACWKARCWAWCC